MKAAFNAKAMARLKNNVGDWKEKWMVVGDEAKPVYISDDIWTGLKTYWNWPKSVRKSLCCSASRLTHDAQENFPIPPHFRTDPTRWEGPTNCKSSIFLKF